MAASDQRSRFVELIRLFGWLGVVGVGGPAAHIAMMRRRVVRRDRWLDDEEFTRMVGACALIPGPNSTELAMALGGRRAGWRGVVVAGTSFIVPAFVIVCAIAWLYGDVLDGGTIASIRRWVVPIVAAIVLEALWSLRTTAVRDRRDALAVAVALVGAAFGAPELLVLVVVGAVAIASRTTPGGSGLAAAALPVLAVADPPSLTRVLLVFLWIGSVIYGSGYVLLVFLESEVVGRGWIETPVLLDAISVGQFTPGPVFTTATFIGWHIGGLAGAVAATLGIFGPSFVFAAFVERVVLLARRSAAFAAFLRGVSSGSIALMGVVLWRLADEALVDGAAVAVFLVSFVAIRGRAYVAALRR